MRRFLLWLAVVYAPLFARGQPAGYADISLPLNRLHLNSAFGYRVHPLRGNWKFHAGIDLAAKQDTVYAVLPGTVTFAGYDPGLGLHVILKHDGNLETIYGHLSQFWVLPSDTIEAAGALGLTGQTGQVTGEHLHFAVKYNHHFINPLAFLRALFTEKGPPL
ncbi:M23 family metallopeptidase [Mucilaginibacter sp. UYCu711]|uniref:M23 family metallopeptidase n=1 Tax=Mucilaginibacter sp. UYCu711 TaxID=3156339 RepID=UPI003D23DD2A